MKKRIDIINLDEENLFMHELPYCKGLHKIVKVGKNKLYLKIDKNCDSAFISAYADVDKAGNMIEYIDSVFVKNDVMLTKRFFLNFEDIAKAAYTTRYWEHELYLRP